MAIETGPAPIAVRNPAGDSPIGKAPSAAPEDAAKDKPTGFMAVLAGLDPASEPKEKAPVEDCRAMPAVDAASVAVSQVPLTPDLADANSGHVTAVISADGVMDGAALLAQSAQWAIAPPVAAEASALSAVPASAAPTSGIGPSGGAQGPKALRTMQDVGAQDVSDGLAQAAVRKLGMAQAQARQTLADAKMEAPTETAVQAQARAQTLATSKMPDITLLPSSPLAALTQAGVVTPPRREEVFRERSVFRSGVTESGPLMQMSAPGALNSTSVATPRDLAPTDVLATEQVAYWSSNDVQNAELKLGGKGDTPVEVSIRMQGNEAHVAFRTDELHARAALENASVHLKDLLQSEGLVLTGVSVGSTGAGDAGNAGNQERPPRQGVRSASVTSIQSASVGGGRPVGQTAGRTLDLFV